MSGLFKAVAEVDTDNRKRVSLAGLRLAVEPNSRYRVEEGPNGELRLIPVYSVTAEELALLRDPAALRQLQENIDAETIPFDARGYAAKALSDCDDAEARAEAERLLTSSSE